MSASDEFPRGWQIESDITGASASVTMPASPNISHVITDMYAKAFWNVGSTPVVVSLIIVVQKASGNFNFGFVALPAQLCVTDDVTFSGKVQCAVGEAVTLTFLGVPVGVDNMVRMQGYDI